MAIDPRLAQLNAVIQVPEGWLILNILETITRLGTLKPIRVLGADLSAV